MIEKDLPKVFAGHRVLHSAPYISALRSVVSAYTLHAPSATYCREMSMVAAMVLLVLSPDQEELVFWMLEALEQRSFKECLGKQSETSLLDYKVPVIHCCLWRSCCSLW